MSPSQDSASPASPPSEPPRRTPLHTEHVAAGASLIDFAGWEMPVRYRTTVPEEHEQVRSRAGLFDLCHMGRLELTGSAVTPWLDRLLTNHYGAMRIGEARYTLICNDEGTILDDAIVYKLAAGERERALLVVNASNRARIVEWIESRSAEAGDATLRDRTGDLAMLAVQGPRSVEILSEAMDGVSQLVAEMEYYTIARLESSAPEILLARTGYTGEDGFEIYLDPAGAPALWKRLLETGGERLLPIGLGARDTLRLEAAMPLYGHEIDETTDPFEARLSFAVKLEKPAGFIGCEALRKKRDTGSGRKLTGFRMKGRRSAREGMKLFVGEREVGRITSGAPSPTLGYPIALGYLQNGLSDGDVARLEVDVRGRREAITTHALPFFSRKRKQQ